MASVSIIRSSIFNLLNKIWDFKSLLLAILPAFLYWMKYLFLR